MKAYLHYIGVISNLIPLAIEKNFVLSEYFESGQNPMAKILFIDRF